MPARLKEGQSAWQSSQNNRSEQNLVTGLLGTAMRTAERWGVEPNWV